MVAPLFAPEPKPRSRFVTWVMISAAAVGLLGLAGYERFVAPADGGAWTPPAGLPRADTPDWLQTLCADSTRELCAAADRARLAEDCVPMRAALHQIDTVAQKLSARGALSTRQHWVLVELYEQGRDLCQFER